MREYHEDQLRPIRTPHTNSLLKGPPGTDVGDLQCELNSDEQGAVVTASAWALDERQRAMVAAGGHIRLSVWQHPIPPLAVAIEGPFCEECDAELEFDGSLFHCPNGHATLQVTEGGDPSKRHLEVHGDDTTDRADSARRAEQAVRRDFSPGPDDDGPMAA